MTWILLAIFCGPYSGASSVSVVFHTQAACELAVKTLKSDVKVPVYAYCFADALK